MPHRVVSLLLIARACGGKVKRIARMEAALAARTRLTSIDVGHVSRGLFRSESSDVASSEVSYASSAVPSLQIDSRPLAEESELTTSEVSHASSVMPSLQIDRRTIALSPLQLMQQLSHSFSSQRTPWSRSSSAQYEFTSALDPEEIMGAAPVSSSTQGAETECAVVERGVRSSLATAVPACSAAPTHTLPEVNPQASAI